jgi:SRSO17 transposase
VELVQQLAALGCRFSVVLADSTYGESYDFTSAISRMGVPYVVAIRSDHAVWTAKGEWQGQPPLTSARRARPEPITTGARIISGR